MKTITITTNVIGGILLKILRHYRVDLKLYSPQQEPLDTGHTLNYTKKLVISSFETLSFITVILKIFLSNKHLPDYWHYKAGLSMRLMKLFIRNK